MKDNFKAMSNEKCEFLQEDGETISDKKRLLKGSGEVIEKAYEGFACQDQLPSLSLR